MPFFFYHLGEWGFLGMGVGESADRTPTLYNVPLALSTELSNGGDWSNTFIRIFFFLSNFIRVLRKLFLLVGAQSVQPKAGLDGFSLLFFMKQIIIMVKFIIENCSFIQTFLFAAVNLLFAFSQSGFEFLPLHPLPAVKTSRQGQ